MGTREGKLSTIRHMANPSCTQLPLKTNCLTASRMWSLEPGRPHHMVRRKASESALYPSLLVVATDAPCANSSSRQAPSKSSSTWSGVCPCLSLALMILSSCSSVSTTSKERPPCTAQCSGVRPSLSFRLTVALYGSRANTLTTLALPAPAALCSDRTAPLPPAVPPPNSCCWALDCRLRRRSVMAYYRGNPGC
ncbi:hypothetical protein E2C01_006545 [Portunus trituberculatus]|uniref:Uncharacterized protein n=1 Tax=Portunus trituberculatus TaxID=210409 RepID=A0A5B7CX54_PORTR|nr:hypothetical protein [Portunus trituberculatus]